MTDTGHLLNGLGASAPVSDFARLPGCIFAPTNVSPRSLFAKDPSGALLHVSQVETGTKGLACPECGTPLRARKGKDRRHHFAHASGAECQTAGETALHQMAKQIIAGGRALSLPAVWVRVPRGYRPLRPVTLATFGRVEVEHWEDGVRPDVVGYEAVIHSGQFDEPRLLIEIRVTHKVGDDKKEELRRRGEPVLEIDLSKVTRRLSYEELANQILTSAPRDWLVHPAIEEHQRTEEEQRSAEAERRARQSRRPENERELHRAAVEQAHLELARPSTEMERQKALTERHRWLGVGAPDPLSILVDDGVFSVEPLLWRTAALADLAPWNAGLRSPSRREPPYLAIVSLGQFRALGYVKPYFLADVLTAQGQRVPGGEAANAILQSFRHIFLKRVLAEAGIPVDTPPREDWFQEAKALLAQRWHYVTKV